MKPVDQITCPVCQTPLSDAARVCPDGGCGYRLPEGYVAGCREAPPLPIAAIGYSGHGKTHLLAAMVLTIRELTLRPWAEEATLEVLDDQTRAKLQDWIDHADNNQALPPTEFRPERPTPMILRVAGLFPPRTLLVYDVAGQSFHDMTKADQCLPALRDAQTVWFVLSPHDLERPDRRSRDLMFLFGAYKTAMSKLEAKLEGRSAVVVVAKGDKLGDKAPDLRDYLDSDPLRAEAAESSERFSLKSCEEGLRQMSLKVEDYVGRVRDVRNLVGLLRKERIEVAFCVTSALGKDAVPGLQAGDASVDAPWARQRVLDPMIWTLLQEKQRSAAQVHLILDPGGEGGVGYPALGGRGLPELLWERLPRHQGLRTWMLGEAGAATAPGQPPPGQPLAKCRCRLLGPLLEPWSQAEPLGGRVVLVTNQLVLDLEDFRSGPWAKRLLLVTTSDRPEVREQWPQVKLIRTVEDLGEVTRFLSPGH